MSEICYFCKDEKIVCQEPSLPLPSVIGRWELELFDGVINTEPKSRKINPEKMEQCAKRTAILDARKKAS